MFKTAEHAEVAFYRAFESADLDAMMAVWADSPNIVCIHPTGPILVGVEAIRESWRAIFAGGGGINLAVAVVQSQEDDTMAVHLVEEYLTVTEDKTQQAHVVATNMFRMEGGSWRLVLHHGSPAARESGGGSGSRSGVAGVAPTLH